MIVIYYRVMCRRGLLLRDESGNVERGHLGTGRIEYVLNDHLGLDVGTAPIQFLGMVTNPTRAYLVATIGAFPDAMARSVDIPTPSELAWYVQPEAAVAVLLMWLALPVVFGVWQFDRANIG